MSVLIAKPVVKNKFWILEDSGQKVATIQAVDEGGSVALVFGTKRELFASFKMLKNKYNIQIAQSEHKKKHLPEVHGFPVQGRAYNAVYDLQQRIPIYTKDNKSKCFFCAGYYWIFQNNEWSQSFCPKLITVKRYQHIGPFHSEQELQENQPCLNNL
jgi:hypothetical protein